VFVFGESFDLSAPALALQAAGIVTLLAGIVTLDRSPIVVELQQRKPGAN
jgi:hypothetical protein